MVLFLWEMLPQFQSFTGDTGLTAFLGLIYSSGPQQCDCLRLLSHWGHRWDPPAMAPNLKLSTVISYYFKQFLTLDMYRLCSCLPPSLYRSSSLPSYPTLRSFSKNKQNPNTATKCPRPRKQNAVSPPPQINKNKNKPKVCMRAHTQTKHQQTEEFIICWSTTPELDLPWSL